VRRVRIELAGISGAPCESPYEPLGGAVHALHLVNKQRERFWRPRLKICIGVEPFKSTGDIRQLLHDMPLLPPLLDALSLLLERPGSHFPLPCGEIGITPVAHSADDLWLL
jgi:hypothetical protein